MNHNGYEFLDSVFQTIAIVFSMLVLYGAFYIISFFPGNQPIDSIFLAECRNLIRPEPRERWIYLLGLFWVTLAPAAIYWILRYCFKKRMSPPAESRAFPIMFLVKEMALAILFFGWLFILAQKTQFPKMGFYSPIIMAATFLFLLIAPSVFLRGRINKIALGIIAGIVAGLYAYLLLINPKMAVSSGYVSYHYDPILAVVNQVLHGKTVLVNATSLYGVGYPHMIAALFKWVPLSITSLSICFVFIIWLSLVFIYLGLCERVGYNSIFALLFMLAAIGFMHPVLISLLAQQAVPEMLPYYPYLPLRVLWGSFFIWYVAFYLRNRNKRYIFIGYILAGISVLWNLDTGAVILVAWTGLLILHALSRSEGWRFNNMALIILRNIFYALLTLGAAFAAYSLFAWVRSGDWPDWKWSFRYQALFYRSGFNLLPMNPLEFWQPLILMYCVSFFYGIRQLIRRENIAAAGWYCYVALFGLGIFSYYQGRSYFHCLWMVSYPAMILAGSMFIDLLKKYHLSARPRLLSSFKRGTILNMVMLGIFIAWGLTYSLAATPTAFHYFKLLNKSLRECRQTAFLDPDNELAPFLKDNTECIIISYLSTYLLTKYHCYSAFPVSSLWSETLLKDQVPLLQATLNNQTAKLVIIEKADSVCFRYLSFDAYREISQTKHFRILQARPR